MHPLENQLENQSIPFFRSLYCSGGKKKQQKTEEIERKTKTNLVFALYCIQAPKASQSFMYSSLALPLRVNALVCNRCLIRSRFREFLCCDPLKCSALKFLSFPTHDTTTMEGVPPPLTTRLILITNLLQRRLQ